MTDNLRATAEKLVDTWDANEFISDEFMSCLQTEIESLRDALAKPHAAPPEPWAWAVVGPDLVDAEGDSVDQLIFWDAQRAMDCMVQHQPSDEPYRLVPLYPEAGMAAPGEHGEGT